MKVLVGLGGLFGFSRVLGFFAWGLSGFLVLRFFLGLHGILSDAVAVVATVKSQRVTLSAL